MNEQLAWSLGKKDAEFLMRWRESNVQAYYGRFQESRRSLKQAMDLAAKIGPLNHTPVFGEQEALQEVEVGNLAESKRSAKGVTAKDQDRDQQLLLALALARAGNLQQADKLAGALAREFPSDTLTQNYCLPTMRAAMKLHESDPAGAVDILRTSLRYDLAYPPAFNSLYPAYIRGIAYLQVGDGRAAAAEFQKVVDHPAIVGRFVTGALAHLQLGRAQAMMGDKVAARKSYQDFLTLWKDADSEIPIYRQAKAEYVRLQ